MPLSVVDSQHFQDFVFSLDNRYQIPSRKHLSSKLLPNESDKIQKLVKTTLQEAPSVCLTMDLGSNRQMKSFLGITAHFIHDWTLHSAMLSCKRFVGRHTAENIRHEYEETTSNYEIGHKITTIVTDNASNMTKAFNFSLPGFDDPTTSAEDDEGEDDTDIEPVDTSQTDDYKYLPFHSACYAHTLQLVVKGGMRDASNHLKTILTKAATIVRYVRHSTHASDILQDEKRLQTANATRWNSQIIMIRSIRAVPEDKLNKLDTVHLTSYERKLLQELCIVLEPFENATQLVQQEKFVTASLTIPVTRGLQHQLKQISAIYNTKMVTTLKTSVENRLANHDQEQALVTAAILDLRFKLRWCTPQEQPTVKSQLLSLASAHQTVDTSDPCSPPPAKMAKTNNGLYSFMSATSEPTQQHAHHLIVAQKLSTTCLSPALPWRLTHFNSGRVNSPSCQPCQLWPASTSPFQHHQSL